MNWYVYGIKKYAFFTGRAGKKEFWMFTLFNIIFGLLALCFDYILGIGLLGSFYDFNFYYFGLLYFLAMLIPSIAITVRRLHDVGKSGLMILLCLIPVIGIIWLIVLIVKNGNLEDNEYGKYPNNDFSDKKLNRIENKIKYSILSSLISGIILLILIRSGVIFIFASVFIFIIILLVDYYILTIKKVIFRLMINFFLFCALLIPLVFLARYYHNRLILESEKKSRIEQLFESGIQTDSTNYNRTENRINVEQKKISSQDNKDNNEAPSLLEQLKSDTTVN
jgi:uncharacterized membrane protein YhaH (DUF805 family)